MTIIYSDWNRLKPRITRVWMHIYSSWYWQISQVNASSDANAWSMILNQFWVHHDQTMLSGDAKLVFHFHTMKWKRKVYVHSGRNCSCSGSEIPSVCPAISLATWLVDVNSCWARAQKNIIYRYRKTIPAFSCLLLPLATCVKRTHDKN